MTQPALLNASWEVVSMVNMTVENDENDEPMIVEESKSKRCKKKEELVEVTLPEV